MSIEVLALVRGNCPHATLGRRVSWHTGNLFPALLLRSSAFVETFEGKPREFGRGSFPVEQHEQNRYLEKPWV
jgi:hypothetical protein